MIQKETGYPPGPDALPAGEATPGIYRAAFLALAAGENRGVALIGASGRCLAANEALARLLGRPGERLAGESLQELLPRSGELREGEEVPCALDLPDGSRRSVRCGLRPAGEDDAFLITVEAVADEEAGRDRGGQVEQKLREELEVLSTLHEASRILSSTLKVEEIGTKLLRLMRGVSGLTAAVIDTEDEEGTVRIWRSSGLDALWPKARFSPPAEAARERALRHGVQQTFEIRAPETNPAPGRSAKTVSALYLPLRVQDRVVGLLEAYSEKSLKDPGRSSVLESLATQAAGTLENARLYRELSERERQLERLVSRLLNAQEEERRRVAYEVHDGLAQTAAAAHHHLQAYSRLRGPEPEETHGTLEGALTLLKRTVGEARRVIAYLRPTALDDFGLQRAIKMEVDELRAEGWEVPFVGDLREEDRFAPEIETALFRVAQQAINNARKHARTKHARIVLRRVGGTVRLRVRDRGDGFDPAELLDEGGSREDGPGFRVGVASMKERITLLGGEFRVLSRPGGGTLVAVKVPLTGEREPTGRGARG